jgi:hypothetical protein
MVMTLFHGLICGVVALYTTRGLRSPCLMMAVRKRQNIVQWSYRGVPLNVVPRIPLLGYPDIDQRNLDWSPSLRQTVSRNAAGIDVGNAEHYVAVPAGRDPEPLRSFGNLRRTCIAWRNG